MLAYTYVERGRFALTEKPRPALRDSREPAVRAFVRDDLAPLMDNADLLKAYTTLMVGG